MSNEVSFRFVDPDGLTRSEDLFGIWQVEHPAGGRAFDTAARSGPTGPLWSVALPAETPVAELGLEQARANLDLAGQRMDRALPRLSAAARPSPPGTSFAIRAGVPEQQLRALLRPRHAGDTGRSFFLEEVTSSWPQVIAEFRTFVAGALRSVTNYAWVETRVEGRLVALTSMAWEGDVQSMWQVDLAADQRLLHSQALDLAIHSRDSLLHLFALAAQGAAIIATAASSPIGPLLALPAAYRFVVQVMQDK
jgi:hypothetical protein